MRLNKKGKPYQEPDQPKKSVIVDSEGNFYRAVKAPAGLCKCGIMMDVDPQKEKYIFPTAKSARHAIAHRVQYVESNNEKIDYKKYHVKDA